MTRNELYVHFGPKLLEALALVSQDEINLLRAKHNLSDRTNDQIKTAIENKLATISDYTWMDENG